MGLQNNQNLYNRTLQRSVLHPRTGTLDPPVPLASGFPTDGAAAALRKQLRFLVLTDTETIRNRWAEGSDQTRRAYLGSGLDGEEDVGEQRVGSEGEVEGADPSQERPEDHEDVEVPAGSRSRTGPNRTHPEPALRFHNFIIKTKSS